MLIKMLRLNKFFIKLFHKFVGEDRFGNKYYQSAKKDYLGNNARYVVYAKIIEPACVPPLWHAWLHHTTDQIPKEDVQEVRDYTKFPYKPVNESRCKYIKWYPK